MSQYKYTFIRGEEKIESTGYNLWSGAENCGLTITVANRLSTYYLQSTKFEDRERYVYAIKKGETYDTRYLVRQGYNKP